MASVGRSPKIRRFRFGGFELDTKLGELRRSGIRLPLHGQPLQVLEMLLLSPRQLVSREQLRQALWPEGTFVDFDDALNNCIRRLRQSLNDDAEAPRFIETLPRRGYRFLADVESLEDNAALAAVNKKEFVTQVVWGTNLRLRKPAKLLAPALLLALVVATVSWYRLRPIHILTDKDVIVLAGFDNRTGEAVFDNTLRTALAIDLEQSPFFSVMPNLRMDEILEQMERAPGDRVTQEIGREICLRTSSKALLVGSVTNIGSHYVLQLKASDCQTGKTLAATGAEAESREKVLESLGRATTRLRSKLGESLASVQKYDQPLEQVTTSSLAALQAFSEGDRTYRQKGVADAVPFFQRAVELDPEFASAYTYLGAIYQSAGELSLSADNLRRAYELHDRLSVLERYMTDGLYYDLVTGESQKAMSQFQLVAHEYPRYLYGRLNLAFEYDFLGQHEQAVTELREVVRLQPDSFVGYTNLGFAYIGSDRLDDAQGVFNQALSRNLEAPSLHRGRYFIAFFKNDAAAMQQELSWAMGKPRAEGAALLLESDTQAYYGRLAKARDVSRRAVAAELRDDAKEPAASIEAMGAIREARLGNAAQARQQAHAALALARDYNTRLESATALACAGDSYVAQQLLDLVSKERPLDTVVQNYWLPTVRAQIELNHGRARRALELVESARPYEYGTDDAPMYPVYVRGQAYLATGNGGAAAIEFQRILSHRGAMLNDVTGALAHLYLGRSRALEARSLQGAAAEDARAKARTAYQDFLTLWKDADPDIPILRQAKAERARL